MEAKGQDWVLNIMVDGALYDVFRFPDSVSLNLGLSTEVTNHVSEKKPRVRGNNNEVTLSLPFKPETREYIKLANLQRRKNLPNGDPNRAVVTIDATCSVDFGDGGLSRVGLIDGTLGDANMDVTGRLGDTTGSPVFTFDSWEEI